MIDFLPNCFSILDFVPSSFSQQHTRKVIARPYSFAKLVPTFSTTKEIVLFTFPTSFTTATCFLQVFSSHLHNHNSILVYSLSFKKSDTLTLLDDICCNCTETWVIFHATLSLLVLWSCHPLFSSYQDCLILFGVLSPAFPSLFALLKLFIGLLYVLFLIVTLYLLVVTLSIQLYFPLVVLSFCCVLLLPCTFPYYSKWVVLYFFLLFKLYKSSSLYSTREHRNRKGGEKEKCHLSHYKATKDSFLSWKEAIF